MAARTKPEVKVTVRIERRPGTPAQIRQFRATFARLLQRAQDEAKE